MAETLKELVERRLAALGINALEAARRVDAERTFVRDILIGRKRSVQGGNIAKLAEAIGTTPEEIAAALARQSRRPASQPPPRRGRSDVVPAALDIPDFQGLPRDLPIYGVAAGAVVPKLGESFLVDTTRIINQVRRPPALARVPGAYALYVAGESMIPEHKPGDLRIVDPDKPPRPGDTVVIRVKLEEGAPEQVFIKTFLGRTPDYVIAAQHNPKATARFKAATVTAVHRVLTIAELLEG